MIESDPSRARSVSDPTDALPPPEFRARLRSLRRDLDDELRALAPVCEISGRCCKFREYGHTLFLAAPEADLLVAEAPPPARPLDDGDTCPWQSDRGLCLARDARPLGCRVYFCDPRPEVQNELFALGERHLARLKALVDEFRLDWDYRPLHRHLAARRPRTRPLEPPGEPPRDAPRHRA